MGEEAGSDDVFERMENGQDAEVVEETDGGDESNRSSRVDDPELEAIKARVREMKEEAEKLKQLQSEVDKQMNLGSPPSISEITSSFDLFVMLGGTITIAQRERAVSSQLTWEKSQITDDTLKI